MNSSMLALVGAFLLPAASFLPAADPQQVGPVDVSRWRGFNLLEKFTLGQNSPFREDDFKWIAELGFNFVRLPVDYRCYVEKEDWLKFREDMLQQIDQAIQFGDKYRVHVCLNLHRAPGFCINPPAQATDLWTNEDTLKVFIAHWVMFARRYQAVPPERLSFNLLNEPMRNSRETYLKVFTRTIEAIQQVDPRRLILVDGNNVGGQPTPEFLRYSNVVQSTRGYHPATISHYKASWMSGSDTWPVPTWPPLLLNGHLYGPSKPDLKSPLGLEGNLPAGTELTLKISRLSFKARLVAKADGQAIGERTFDPAANPADWKRAQPALQWVIHQPVSELLFKVVLPKAARQLTVENVDGDWILFSELGLQSPDGPRRVQGADSTWGQRQRVHPVGPDGSLRPPAGLEPNQPLVDYLKPWREISARGAPVFVGEWGCFNRTPHPVALAWMNAWLEQWKQARFGWALWNFRGSFGLLDSGRQDVAYEDWRGHKLDRRMLTLLQQYAP